MAETKIKLTIDARMINHSGIGTYLQNILPFVVKSFDTTLIGEKNILSQFDFTNNCEIINEESKIYSLKEQVKIPFKFPNSDIYWAPHINFPRLPLKTIKTLLTVHDVYHLAFKKDLSFTQKLYSEWVIKSGIKKVDKIITVSEFSKSEMLKYTGVNANKITVVHNGVDRERYRVIVDKPEIEKMKNKFNLPEKFILFVGNIKPNKNLKQLLTSFKSIQYQIPDYDLLIVGRKDGFVISDGSINNFVDSNLDLKKKIHFAGVVSREELTYLYNLAQLFVFPSLYEGFGLPPLEAMACGCPVIVSKVCSLPEVCGDATIYFDPYKQHDLDEKILLVVNDNDLRNQLKIKGLDHVKKFSWEESANKTIEVLNLLLS